MKNILIIIPSLGAGGAEKVLIDILNRFDYCNYHVDLVVIHYYGPYLSQVNDNVKVFYLYKGCGSTLSRIIDKSEKLLSIFDLIKKYKIRKTIKKIYDTIISFTTNEALYYHSFLFDKANKNISWIHVDVLKNHNNYPFKSKQDEIRAYEHIDQLVFVSHDAQKAFNLVFPKIQNPQRVIYNLIDRETIIKRAKEENILNDKPTIISIGRLIPVKGYSRFIEVAKLLKADGINFQCQILGAGQLQEELHNQILREGVEDVVFLLGFKSNPYPYLRAADIFLSCSLSEAYPLVVCEALCLGKAIISTKTTGPIEILQDKYGILAEQDINDIYLKLKKLLTNSELLNEYQQRALEGSNRFDPLYTMSEIYKVL